MFKVAVKEIKAPEETPIDDELAKKLGLADLATLKDRVREQLESDYKGASRAPPAQCAGTTRGGGAPKPLGVKLTDIEAPFELEGGAYHHEG